MTEALIDPVVICTKATHIDLPVEDLMGHALARKEGVLASNQALVVTTGARTGRSPRDRFIVDTPAVHERIHWGTVNRPFSSEHFDRLWVKAEHDLAAKEHYVSHLRVGADARHYIPVTVTTEYAWHNLFATQLLIRDEAEIHRENPMWQIISIPSLKLDPEKDHSASDAIILLNFEARKILIFGTHYAGEIKKAMFTVMNDAMPDRDVLPMHCAANAKDDGKDVVLFFGLSGTGKTTLSADPSRALIGDDEHGWGPSGVFNFEGGCYAKCIKLSREHEPVIWKALRYGAVLENVVLDPVTREPRYDDASLTQNTRAAYPREYIDRRVVSNQGEHPKAVIFLTCDLYGVLPPVARLSGEQAAYYFLNGYTALMGSTEVGSAQAIQPTFSMCFGAPFFPRSPKVYVDLLMKRLDQVGCPVYLVNTGWHGGAYGEGGERFDIPTTRQIVASICEGAIEQASFEPYPYFHFEIPRHLSGVEERLLNPLKDWKDRDAYLAHASRLIRAFRENMKAFESLVDPAVVQAGPSDIEG